jgi:hypothetical protein
MGSVRSVTSTTLGGSSENGQHARKSREKRGGITENGWAVKSELRARTAEACTVVDVESVTAPWHREEAGTERKEKEVKGSSFLSWRSIYVQVLLDRHQSPDSSGAERVTPVFGTIIRSSVQIAVGTDFLLLGIAVSSAAALLSQPQHREEAIGRPVCHHNLSCSPLAMWTFELQLCNPSSIFFPSSAWSARGLVVQCSFEAGKRRRHF